MSSPVQPLPYPGWVRDVFAAIDAMDAARFGTFLHPEVRFQFGNMPVVSGAGQATAFVAGFFESIAAIRHEVPDVFDWGDTWACRGRVTYTRHTGSTLEVPFANFFGLCDGRILSYQIYADTSQLPAA
jgi:ketosteroid isomerase-like protein